MTKIKLSEWAEKNGITYQTAYRWYRADRLPCKSITQTPTGTILVEELDEIDTKDLIPPNEQTIVQHLVSAYRKIQQQQQSKQEKEELKDQKKIKDFNEGKLVYEDVSCKEKQEILKGFGFGKPEAPDLLKKIAKRDTLTIDDKIELIHKDIVKVSTDIQMHGNDLEQIMSNLFGEEKTVYERFKNMIMYEVGKQIHMIFKDVKDMDSFKSSMVKLGLMIQAHMVFSEKEWNAHHKRVDAEKQKLEKKIKQIEDAMTSLGTGIPDEKAMEKFCKDTEELTKDIRNHDDPGFHQPTNVEN